DTYWSQCDKRLLTSIKPDRRRGNHHQIRDMATACGAAVVWLDCRMPAERELMRKFLADMQAGKAIILGWYTSERSGITTASEFGIGTIPADHYNSSTMFAGTDHRIAIPTVPKKPPLENNIYVAVFISDGDNIQYVQRAMRRIWDRAADSRGRVPLNWTIAPGLVDIGPGILNYYYQNATAQDCFVAGPSGMGYLMPINTLAELGAPIGSHLTEDHRMSGYAQLTNTYLQRAGLRVATIWDDMALAHRAIYAQECRSLYGATVQNFKDVPEVASSVEAKRTRFEKLVVPYAGSYEHLHRSLTREIRNWDVQAPLFLAYQVSIWGEMKPARIVQFVNDIQREYGERVTFVRADHYFTLYNEAEHLPFNLVMCSETTARSVHEELAIPQVIDGSPSTQWIAEQPGTAVIEIDCGATYHISRYAIRHGGSPEDTSAHKSRNFDLSASSDGQDWKTVDSVRDNIQSLTDRDLSPTDARYVRLTILDPGDDQRAQVADIEVYGSR
ncbi:MAG: discoidin domain-containing protein, partial [Planctomycetales bacterium]|nr:discoidin domain-containing protein [Planctomycetales bacterium]